MKSRFHTGLGLVLALGLLAAGGGLITWASPAPEPIVAAPTGAPIGPCQMFPPDNVWNARIDHLPVDAKSIAYVNGIGASGGLKADFGSGLWNGGPIGIPYTTVLGSQPLVTVTFDYDDESDPGPYPIPPNAPIEGGPDADGDRHVLVVDTGHCKLYELYYSWPQPDGSWQAGSGAIFDLNSNALRPDTWTSADAAGFAILPGLVRYDEVASGVINHAIRFTVPQTRRAYVWPARHYASDLTDPNLPPMGQRFRLKASFDISGFSPKNRVILTALKTYGMFVADNGAAWYISGVPDERWNNDELRELLTVHGSDFEAVDESSLMADPDSGRVANFTSAATVTLSAGWNLVSLPVQPISGNVASLVAGATPSGRIAEVWAFDRGGSNCTAGTWKYYKPGDGSSTLSTVDHKMGLWVRATGATTLNVTGTLPTSTQIPLCSGWNLAGYPASTGEAVGTSLSGLPVTRALTYQAGGWLNWEKNIPYGNALASLEPERGYWLYATGPTTWTVP